jgi:GGDEF domain-containing protein
MPDRKTAPTDHTSPEARAELRRAALEYHEFPIPGKVAIQATKQLLNQLQAPYDAAGLGLQLTASVGVAVYPDHGARPD